MYPSAIQKLLKQFYKLPGVGPRTAERFVFFLLKLREAELVEFGHALASLKKNLHECGNCFNLSEKELCNICSDPRRDKDVLCVVAETREIPAIEQTGEYHGLYFVLGGNLDTIKGITPHDLRFRELVAKLQNPIVTPKEIIFGLNPHIEGETTALYLKKILEQFPDIRTTILARGLPTGGDLEYADAKTVTDALINRKKV